jgi:peroxiredoxin
MTPADAAPIAPALRVSHWLNSEQPIALADLRGKVVLIHAFQMLCPGCVMNSMPQAVRIWQHYQHRGGDIQVVVMGLHTVFEHHEVMTPAALAVYLHEFRIPFPVAVDAAGTDGPIPQTMSAYKTQGTPTTLLIDGAGRLRKAHFGVEPDQRVVADIDALIDKLETK